MIMFGSSLTKTTKVRASIAAGVYFVLVLASLGAIWIAVARLDDGYDSLRAAETMLSQLEGRSPRTAKDMAAGFSGAPAGSPFLEGKTLTVAGAALLQRVLGAVQRVGGNVLSSQVNLQTADAKNGRIRLTVSCDVEEVGLQPLLYNIEAGMPFLFIDELVVQGPAKGARKGRMHVVLNVSGQWRGAQP